MSKFYSDYKCCFFATGENALKAASLYLYHGMASSLNGLREKIDKCCCFKSTLLPDGIKIELKDALSPYELADHVQEILINTKLMALERYNKKEYLDANDIKDIEQTAYSSLYRAHGGRLSLTAELTQSCNKYISNYIERAFLNAFYQKHGNFPDPTRPENLETLEVEWLTEFNGETEIFVPFTDFKITYGTTDRQYKRGAECGYQNSLTYWTQKLLEHPELNLDGEEEYKKSFLVEELGVYDRNLVAAKNYGIISSPRRGIYKLDFLRDRILARNILEAQQEKEMEGLTF